MTQAEITRPVEEVPARPPSGPGLRPYDVFTYLLHLVGGFVVGAIVLAAVAVVVTLVAGGRVAFLETRGVPVFIGVAASVAVFAFLRTAKSRDTSALAVSAVGVVVLLAVGAYLYRPVFLHDAQERMERALRVWNSNDSGAVDDFRGDLVNWTSTVSEYQRDVAAVVGAHITQQDFRTLAQKALTSLQETTVSMQAHASAAHNGKLRSALRDFAGVYIDELSGLKLVSSGILRNDFSSLRSGDDTFKSAQKRAITVFDERIRPLLDRAGFDTEGFRQAIGA